MMWQKVTAGLSVAILAMATAANGQIGRQDGSVGRAIVISGAPGSGIQQQAALLGYSVQQPGQAAGGQASGQQQGAEPQPAPQSAQQEAMAAECNTCGECDQCAPCKRSRCKHRLDIFVDWLYLQARGADLGFAYPTDEAFGRPLGATDQLDYDYEEEGIRYGVGMQLGCSPYQIRFIGTHFNTGTNAAGWPGPGLTLQTLLLNSPDPLSADAASSTFALARGIIGFDTYDLDLVKSFYRNGCGQFAGWLGVRVADMDQSLRVIYDDDIVHSGQDLRGAGVRAGFGGERRFGIFKAFGSLSGSLLATSMNVDYRQTNIPDGVVVNYAQDIDRVLPVVDLEVGIGIQATRHLSLSVGYMYSMWFNVVTAPELIQALQTSYGGDIRGDFTGDVRDDLTFDGLFTRVEVRW